MKARTVATPLAVGLDGHRLGQHDVDRSHPHPSPAIALEVTGYRDEGTADVFLMAHVRGWRHRDELSVDQFPATAVVGRAA